MKQGTLFFDRECGRYNFHYKDEDGDKHDYGGIHCGTGPCGDGDGQRMVFGRTAGIKAEWAGSKAKVSLKSFRKLKNFIRKR